MKYVIYTLIGLGFSERLSETVELSAMQNLINVILWPRFIGDIIAMEWISLVT